jgi:hypothetical protein
MAFTEDLAEYFSEDDFAVIARYDGKRDVPVLFDAAYLETLGVQSTGPVAFGKSTDFPAATCIGKTLVVNGTSYTIRHREPQDDGAVVLLRLNGP